MNHIDRLLRAHPELRGIDYQRLVQRAKLDPTGTWQELAEASVPIVYTTALRLARGMTDPVAVAELATQQVFEMIHQDDHAVLREYVGFGQWPTLLIRLTQQTEVLASRRIEREFPADELEETIELNDPDAPIAALDPRIAQLLDQEGEPLLTATAKTIRVLHRRDRLLLGMRYEQGLTLRELDHLFRLGTPQRVAALLERVVLGLQPVRAVLEAWNAPPTQREPVMRRITHRLYQRASMETAEGKRTAPALQHR